MRKYGKKKEVSLDPLSYNIGLVGESGIGKTSVINEMCLTLAGEDGYIMLDCGKESGHNAIHNIVSEEVPDWATFAEITDDIIDNKMTDYQELKVIVLDTYDQLMELAEKEVIRLHAIANGGKKVDSINGAFGGFGAGMDKAIDIVLDRLWKLKSVGVSFIIIGHVKKRDIDDAVTGESYSMLTTSMTQRYFNAIKTKLDFLGVASIDREIVKEKTGKKNIVTKQEEVKGRIKNESRVITFRDDNYSIDSKSRFANIVDRIPLDSNSLIEALKDAILSEFNKGSKTVDEGMAEQKKKQDKAVKSALEQIKQDKAIDELEKQREEFINTISNQFSDADIPTQKKAKAILTKKGCKKFTDPALPIEALQEIAGLF